MAQKSKIEWTDETWNPVTGCTKVSTGCRNCYAERMAKRMKLMGQVRYRNEFEVTLQPDIVERPLRWRKPRMVFVNSMSDLFHKEVQIEYIQEAFATMEAASRHTFQILTKRSARLKRLAHLLPWPPNVWMGVSVETPSFYSRIEDLGTVPAKVRFLSLEPMLKDLPGLPLEKMHWVIAGGESGPKARPMSPDWARRVRDQCREADVPFFFKQWGGVNKKKAGRILDFKTWDEFPTPRSS